MKKILLVPAVLFSTFFLAQKSEFSNNYSTTSLKEIQKKIPQNEKHEFYKQYFRALITEEMTSKFSYKNYSDVVLRKFADTIIAINRMEENSKESSEIIKNIDRNFSIDSANAIDNYHLLAANIGLYPDQMFPIVSSEPDEFTIFETIPGEILTYSQQSGVFTGLYFSSYKINGSNVDPINPYPNDNKFINKVSKYAKSGWRFQPRAGYGIEKNKLGEYIISTSLYTAEDSNAAPSMSIEYKTTDFKRFIPLRIAKNDDDVKWTVIK
ncbi:MULTISPECIES: hypothetical protein [Chryseobacterium]|uniref:DUF4844 domain-containing protein n=1 Tax=Chryseobacterium piscium TaxID=333702 RepID=A0A3D9BRX4_9FLAO|nr:MULTISPECIES: hypothetical protein [Chryseobacterium]REC40918.1 hypothetical protein DRF69_16820 [Chryseobacterium sp. 5_R23647]REC56284.1 hypothetical protein DRF62_04250 [Chryseobacterium piscium]